MKAIILAAGRGSRMGGMTAEQPKCLVKFRGKTLLAAQMDSLRAAGVDEIGIVTGYRRELIAKFASREFYNSRWAETNMVSSLEVASEWLRHEPCIVSYSDIFYEASAIKLLLESDAALALTYDPHWLVQWRKRFSDPLSDAETFRIGADGFLMDIGEKPTTIEEIEGQYMGLLKFTPNAWQTLSDVREGMSSDVRDRMHMTGTLRLLIQRNRIRITPLRYEGAWGEIDRQQDLKAFDILPAHQ